MSDLRKKIASLGLAASGLLISPLASAGAPPCYPNCDTLQVSEPGMLYLIALALVGAAIVRRLRK